MKFVLSVALMIWAATVNPAIADQVPQTSKTSGLEKAGPRACIAIADLINSEIPKSATRCVLLSTDEKSPYHSEIYSFHLISSTSSRSEWRVAACKSAGSVMSEGAGVGFDKLFFGSGKTGEKSAAVFGYRCRDIYRKWRDGRASDADITKFVNREFLLGPIEPKFGK